jgi:WD40 repeat protein
MNQERESIRLFSLCSISIALIFCSPIISAGQSDDPLPKHATQRFGKTGKIPKANGVYRLKYSPDGGLLASRNSENIVSVYDVNKQTTLCEVDGHDNNWIETINFSPDSRHFVTAAGSGEKIKIWNAQTGKLENEIDTDGSAAVFSSDGEEIHVLGETHVESYSWPGVQMTRQRKWKSQNETRSGMSEDGRLVVSYRSLNRQIYQTQIVDVETKSRINLDGPTGVPKWVTISPNRLWVAIAYHRDSKIRLWDMRDPHNKKFTLIKHEETVQSLSFSNDNRFLISSGWDEKVIAWDLLTRQIIGEFTGHTDHVNATAFAPLDFTFATGASGTSDCSTIIWNLEDFILFQVQPATEDDFDSIWKRLGLNSMNHAMKSAASLIKIEDNAVAYLETKTATDLQVQSSGSCAKLISMLGSRDYEERESATQELMKQRTNFEDELLAALKKCKYAEIRYRLTMILKKKVRRVTASVVDSRRWHRIIFILEQIASDKAQALLSKIASGHQDIDIARDAKDAFQRNELRKEKK